MTTAPTTTADAIRAEIAALEAAREMIASDSGHHARPRITALYETATGERYGTTSYAGANPVRCTVAEAQDGAIGPLHIWPDAVARIRAKAGRLTAAKRELAARTATAHAPTRIAPTPGFTSYMLADTARAAMHAAAEISRITGVDVHTITPVQADLHWLLCPAAKTESEEWKAGKYNLTTKTRAVFRRRTVIHVDHGCARLLASPFGKISFRRQGDKIQVAGHRDQWIDVGSVHSIIEQTTGVVMDGQICPDQRAEWTAVPEGTKWDECGHGEYALAIAH